jgi:hypothetical protein
MENSNTGFGVRQPSAGSRNDIATAATDKDKQAVINGRQAVSRICGAAIIAVQARLRELSSRIEHAIHMNEGTVRTECLIAADGTGQSFIEKSIREASKLYLNAATDDISVCWRERAGLRAQLREIGNFSLLGEEQPQPENFENLQYLKAKVMAS